MPISAKDLQAALPDLESTQCCEGLEKAVTIHRDPWGIPHIQAEGGSRPVLRPRLCHSPRPPVAYGLRSPPSLRPLVRMGWPCRTGPRPPLASRGHGPHRQVGLRSVQSPSSRHARRVRRWRQRLFGDDNGPTRRIPTPRPRPRTVESWHCLAVYKMRNSLLGTFESKLWRTRLAQVVGPENLAPLIKGYPQGHLLTVPPGTEYQENRSTASRPSVAKPTPAPMRGPSRVSTRIRACRWWLATRTAASTPLLSITRSTSPARTSPSAATRCPASRHPALLPQRVRGLGHDLRQC